MPQFLLTNNSTQITPTAARRKVLTSEAAKLLLQAALARNKDIRDKLRDPNTRIAPLHMSQAPRIKVTQQLLQMSQQIAPSPVLSAFQVLGGYKRQVVTASPAGPSSIETAPLVPSLLLQQDHDSSQVSNTPFLAYDKDTSDLSFSLYPNSRSRKSQDEQVF